MKLSAVCRTLDGEILGDQASADMHIEMATASDLLSDVLAFSAEGTRALLLTGLVNPQVIRTAEMVDISAVCYVRGKRPDPSTVELAKELHVPILCTALGLFEACGRLHAEGLQGCTAD